MRNIMLLGLLLSLMGCGQPNPQIDSSEPSYEDGLAPLVQSKQQDNIPNHYIVVLNESSTLLSTYTSNKQFINTLSLDPKDIKVKSLYKATITGFSATLNDKALNQLRRNPDVKYIEQDTNIKQSIPVMTQVSSLHTPDLDEKVEQRYPLSWGLDRIDQRKRPLDSSYSYKESATGKGVSIYIIDSGIYSDHVDFSTSNPADFSNRVRRGINTSTDPKGTYTGRATHAAATAAGKRYGVAKNAQLVDVKVFDSNGQGTLSRIMDGIEWTAIDAKYKGPAVANISFTTPRSQALNEVVEKAIKTRNLVVVASSGNGYPSDSCNASPAGAAGVITVAASTATDDRSPFTSGGKCVDLFAPGHDINSAWIGHPYSIGSVYDINTAAQHVTGAVALLQSQQPLRKWTPKEVMDTLIANSTKDGIPSLPPPFSSDIPHERLLYTNP